MVKPSTAGWTAIEICTAAVESALTTRSPALQAAMTVAKWAAKRILSFLKSPAGALHLISSKGCNTADWFAAAQPAAFSDPFHFLFS